MQFNTLDDIRSFCRELPEGDEATAAAATLRQQNLTKPPGSLGRLEEVAIWLARWQRRELIEKMPGFAPGIFVLREHDPEKCEAVFREDHAQSRG